ncbi:hypothetical protein KP509_07G013500 [Ceratopteris richardii]|uniref:Protein kinase domain-containing protein n=1 Tax=Ceratopteris richardii TaxID=49495 RepID=A0A8T2UC18_CERRI|nr:hypothetical protein KP509_07G013500 [Ceratopteris richardii]
MAVCQSKNSRKACPAKQHWNSHSSDLVTAYEKFNAPPHRYKESSPRKSTHKLGKIVITLSTIIGGVGIMSALAIFAITYWKLYSKSKEVHCVLRSHNLEYIHDIGPDQIFLSNTSTAFTEKQEPPAKSFTLEELKLSSKNFCSENLIKAGGSGVVYRGVLPDGMPVAIKRFSGITDQGHEEFQNEIRLLQNGHSSAHVMQLLGYCSEQNERLLVYELMSHGSLLDYLKGGRQRLPAVILDWKTRISIALDSARGLRYLHDLNPPIVHRDVKPSNILLDGNFRAKVADFRLSKLIPLCEDSHVVTRVIGTFGYLAPDYSITGKLTAKVDVYSFGVVLLELLSGQNILFLSEGGTTEFLVHWAKPLLKDKKMRRLVIDPGLREDCPPKATELMAGLILSCLELDPDRRPLMVTVESILTIIADIPTVKAKVINKNQ